MTMSQSSTSHQQTIRDSQSVFSLRAECAHDLNKFVEQCENAGVSLTMTVIRDDGLFPDVECEFLCATGIETLRNIIRRIDDGHVMLQTLRACPFGDNGFERDYDLE